MFNSKSFANSYDYSILSPKASANATVIFQSGDINGDGKINLSDVLSLRRFIAKPTKWNLTTAQQKKADVNGDSKVNLSDTLKLRRYIAAISNTAIAKKNPDWLNLYKVTTSSISITKNPTKTTYKKGESLDRSGGIVTVKYSDNTSSTINLDSPQVTVTKFDSSKLGEQTLTVTYLGETTTFKVTVTSNEKFDISSNTLNNGDVILAGSTFEMYIDINIANYKVDTNKIRILNSNEVSLSGAIVSSSNTIEKGGATTDKPIVSTSGNRVKISAKTYDEISKLGYLVVELQAGFLTASGYSSELTRYTYYVASLNVSTKTNNNTAAFTTTVGVHNSFYIKNYYYGDIDKTYTQNISTTGKTASTTNEYTYTNLSNASHKVTVEIVFYIDKNNTTYEKSGMISKTFSVSSNNNDVEIHYIDLDNNTATQDAIFLKIPYGTSYKTMLIDTGRLKTVDALDKYLRIDNKLVSTTTTTSGNYKYVPIDYLLVTHFDGDHYGGLVSTTPNDTFNSSLTGITYNESKGYQENRAKNKLNGVQMFYYFKNVIFGCNYADMVDTEDEDLQALVAYAKNRNLITVTAGNVLQIGNVTFNIFNPYPKENVPLNWLGDYYKGTEYFRNKEWICLKDASKRLDSNGNAIYNANGIGVKNLAQTSTNNSSIVTKLIVGSGKTLLAGDLTFYGEEILLGKIPGELSGNKGLAIDESKTSTNYINLVTDLKSKYNLTEAQLESKYHLSRFTKKDLSATVLKKGHHWYWNSTSLELLNNVKPSKIILTNAYYNTTSTDSLKIAIKYDALIYRLTNYFNISTSNSWTNCIYCTYGNKVISYSNGTVKK